MAMVRIECPSCRFSFQVPVSSSESRVRCVKCRGAFTVTMRRKPTPGGSPPAPATARRPTSPAPQHAVPRPARRRGFLFKAVVFLVLAGTTAAGIAWTIVPRDAAPGEQDQRKSTGGSEQNQEEIAGGQARQDADDTPQQIQWEYVRDNDGRPLKLIHPGGGQTRFRYVAHDNHPSVRQVVKTLPDDSRVVVELDRLGRRKRMTDTLGEVRYDHEGIHLTRVQRQDQPILSVTADSRGEATALSFGPEWEVKYVRDFLGRLERIDTPAGPISFRHRPAEGLVVRTLPGGTETHWQTRPDGKLESILHRDARGEMLLKLTYHYEPDGLIRKIIEEKPGATRTVSHEYDSVRRLIVVDDSLLGRTSYRYDKVGNRLELKGPEKENLASTYDWMDRLRRHGDEECRHDKAGNLTRYTRTGKAVKVDYTAETLLAAVEAGGTSVRYQHDGDGNLVVRTSGGKKTTFVPDPASKVWRPLLAMSEGGDRRLYVWQNDVPVAAVEKGKTVFYLEDHLGSVRGEVDTAGKILRHCDYCPFGTPRQPADELRPGFAGLFYDPQASLYLTRGRAYDPTLGRFLQRDPEHRAPFGSQKDFSSYVYCGADPVNFIDRDGCSPRLLPSLDELHFFKDRIGEFLSLEATRVDQDKRFFAASEHSHPPNLWGRWGAFGDTITGGLYPGEPDSPGQAKAALFWDTIFPGRAGLGLLYDSSVIARDGFTLKNVDRLVGDVGAAVGGGMASKRFVPASAAVPLQSGFRALGALSDAGDILAAERGSVPGPVGGIYLRGAGQALKDLGRLRGIAFDGNGRLILLGEDAGDVKLPPLRLDDLVTVFRAVEKGETPWVSIDPMPKDVDGPLHLVTMSKATEDTYPGWVLYEADRLFKSFITGQDSISGQSLQVRTPGYQSALDYDLAHLDTAPKSKIWNRVWFEPAEVHRRASTDRTLTLLDVPLRAQVVASKLVPNPKGKPLEDDPDRPPHRSLQLEMEWITKNYPAMAQEVLATPPAEANVGSRVLVFEELQRLALMSALAEVLQDQGRPMPSWMQGIQVKPCPVPRKTPYPYVTKWTSDKKNSRCWGGVTFNVSEKAIRRSEKDAEADTLAPLVQRAIALTPSLTRVSFEHQGKRYHAVALPGNDTREFGALQMAAADLRLPLPNGKDLSLKRQHSSYCEQSDVLGTAWTLDLPRLDTIPHNVRRDEKGGRRWDTVWRLTSPLQSCTATFSGLRFVPEVNGEVWAPDQPGLVLAMFSSDDPSLGTNVVLLRDGRRWYFDKADQFSAVRDGSLTVRYLRNDRQQVIALEALQNKKKIAEVKLDYDENGRVRLASAGSGERVQYHYVGGLLTRVSGPQGSIEYRYTNGLIAEVLHDGKTVERLEYAANGRLLRRLPEGEEPREFTIQAGADTTTLTMTRKGKVVDTSTFDTAMRPVRRTDANGVRWEWKRDGKDELEITRKAPTGEELITRRDAKGTLTTWKLPEGMTVSATHDSAGKLTELKQGEKVLARHQWNGDWLISSTFETFALRRGYDGARLTSLFCSATGNPATWLNVELNVQGKPATITDPNGLQIQLTHDSDGRLTGWKDNRGSVSIRRPDAVTKVEESTWGDRVQSSFVAGNPALLKEVLVQCQGKEAAAQFDEGRPILFRSFDGAETSVGYHKEAKDKGQLRDIHLPNGVVLRYEFDEGQLRAVTSSTGSRLEYQFDSKGRLLKLTQKRSK